MERDYQGHGWSRLPDTALKYGIAVFKAKLADHERIVTGAHDGPLYEQGRWLKNANHPVCA